MRDEKCTMCGAQTVLCVSNMSSDGSTTSRVACCDSCVPWAKPWPVERAKHGARHGKCECGAELEHFSGPNAGGVLCPECDSEYVGELRELNEEETAQHMSELDEAAWELTERGLRDRIVRKLELSEGMVLITGGEGLYTAGEDLPTAIENLQTVRRGRLPVGREIRARTSDDVRALELELSALRELSPHLLSVTSTQLTQAAGIHSADPKGRVLLHLARVLYVLSEEGKHPEGAGRI